MVDGRFGSTDLPSGTPYRWSVATVPGGAVRRWSAAIREIEVLEPWLTESHWDDTYWDDVATLIVHEIGEMPTPVAALASLRSALRTTFPEAALESNNGLYLDQLDRRLDLIVATALRSP